MSTVTKLLIALCSGTMFSTVAAQQQSTMSIICAESEKIFTHLSKNYGESPVVTGRTELNSVSDATMSLWMNPTTNTWTIVYTLGAGSCIIGVGDRFNIVSEKKTPSKPASRL